MGDQDLELMAMVLVLDLLTTMTTTEQVDLDQEIMITMDLGQDLELMTTMVQDLDSELMTTMDQDLDLVLMTMVLVLDLLITMTTMGLLLENKKICKSMIYISIIKLKFPIKK